MSVKSTYNFVPAPNEEEVFKPDWADQVSHDVPFSDGESGEIELKITAETPIFIRNGHCKEDSKAFETYIEEKKKNANFQPSSADQNKIDRYLSFSNFIDEKGEKQYFIPSSSLKGMFRNVLEIMTSSRMRQIKGINNNSFDIFGLRDMNNEEYKNNEIRGVKSGWLKIENNKWAIFPCENHRISLISIEEKYGLEANSLKNLNVVEKYEQIKFGLGWALEKFSFVSDLGRFVGNEYNFDNEGDFQGSVVMFGDIYNKRFDFIFSNPNVESIDLEPGLIGRFDSLEQENENSLWKYLRNKKINEIPVFYKQETIGNKTLIKHFGFSKLYKLNDGKYLNELNPIRSYLNSSTYKKMDLAESIFGQTRLDKSLKGRVFFSHAVCTSENEESIERIKRVLNSPKASFYPAYLKQSGTNGYLAANINYSTYRNEEAELRGFKRYPIHIEIKREIQTQNENISLLFKPLSAGSTFTAKIRFHNLRKAEIGALVSSISFHDNQEKFFHTIGGAKPFGFGKIRVTILSIEKYKLYLQSFEELMNQLDSNWINSKALKELTSMASIPINEEIEDRLTYPVLRPTNEFNVAKINKEFLEEYSIQNGEYSIKSLLDN